MDKELIERLMREVCESGNARNEPLKDTFFQFASRIAEECAKVAEQFGCGAVTGADGETIAPEDTAGDDAAAAIRAKFCECHAVSDGGIVDPEYQFSEIVGEAFDSRFPPRADAHPLMIRQRKEQRRVWFEAVGWQRGRAVKFCES